MAKEGNDMGLVFDSKKIQIVPIKSVRLNTWNPKDMDTDEYHKIYKGIKQKGLRLPIIVRENDGYEIIDGEQRYRACLDLGFANVIIYNEGKISDNQAKELTIWYQQQVPFNEIKLAGLIKELTESGEILQLPYTEEELNIYKNLYDFEWDKYTDKDLELVTNEERENEVIKEEVYYIRIKKQQLANLIKKTKPKQRRIEFEQLQNYFKFIDDDIINL